VVYYREEVFAKDGCKSKARYGTWFYAKYNKKSSGQVSGTYPDNIHPPAAFPLRKYFKESLTPGVYD